MEIKLKSKAIHLEQTFRYEQRQKYKLGINCNRKQQQKCVHCININKYHAFNRVTVSVVRMTVYRSQKRPKILIDRHAKKTIDDKNIDFRIKNIKNMFFSLL